MCTGQCVDTQANPANCGTCGTTCGLGEACSAGSCRPGAASKTDNCAGLANVTLSEIAVYQTVEVPIMKNGTALAASARNTDVVADKDAFFRVFITVPSGFATRTLSARLFVKSQGILASYFDKKLISRTSQAAELATTFQIAVPRAQIASDANYAIEVVECTAGAAAGGSGTGMTGAGGATASGAARFPATGATPLGARPTGGLKIRLIPLRANGLLPDTSSAVLTGYRAMMMAAYPITSVDFTVGNPLAVPDDQDWSAMLDQVRAQRLSDAPAADVYYFGVLKPTSTLAQYCGRGCTAGIGFVPQGTPTEVVSERCALGLAYNDEQSFQTMVHEVGHNHGRNHAPCPNTGIAGVDPNYPYPQAAVGVYGWDARSQTLVPPSRTDIMSYCDPRWISDYTYDAILNRVAAVNAAAEVLSTPVALHTFRVLLLDARGARWGLPINTPSLPAGKPEQAQVLDRSGVVIASVEVYRAVVSDIDAFSIQVPAPKPGWFAVRVAGAQALAFAP